MWEIYAYQNADSLFGIFNAAAAIHGSGDYMAAVAAVAFCGFIAALVAYAFAPEKLQGWKWLATVLLVFSVLIVPRVTVGVETQGPSLQVAVDENKAKMNALLDTLKKEGVAEKDMRTSNYSVYTERLSAPDGSGTGQLIYHVANQVEVTVRDVNQLGDVLDKAVAAGANNIYGVYFNVEDTARLDADARTKAVADAQARAADLARLNGVELGEVLSVSEVVGGATPMYRMAEGMGGGGTPVQPGELEMAVSLQITYAIK